MKAWERVEEGTRRGEREEQGNGLGKTYGMMLRHSFHLLFMNAELTVHSVLPRALLSLQTLNRPVISVLLEERAQFWGFLSFFFFFCEKKKKAGTAPF